MQLQSKLNNTPGVMTGKGPVSAIANIANRSMLGKTKSGEFAGNLEDAKAAREKQIHEAASGLVAHALILPMLKQIRQGSFNKEGVLAPGNGEKAFGTQFDIEIAESVARSPNMAVTQSLAKRLMARDERIYSTAKLKEMNAKGLDVNG